MIYKKGEIVEAMAMGTNDPKYPLNGDLCIVVCDFDGSEFDILRVIPVFATNPCEQDWYAYRFKSTGKFVTESTCQI